VIQLSPCCHYSIGEGARKEYPLGGTAWYQTYKINICEKCGNEVEYALLEDEETGEILGSVTL